MRRNCMGSYISKLTIFSESQQNQTHEFHQPNQLLPVTEKSSNSHACLTDIKLFVGDCNFTYLLIISSLLKGFLISTALKVSTT